MTRCQRALALLLAALPAFAAAPRAQTGSAAAPDAEPAPLRLMSFNIRYGTAADGDDAWPARRAFVADTIERHDPQIIGLQEALDFQLAWLSERFPQFVTLGSGRDADGGGEHCAILVDRARFRIAGCGSYWLSETPESPGSRGWDAALPRICTWAQLVDRETGRQIRVSNLHLDHRGLRSRTEAARLVADRLADSPLPQVVFGDMNAPEGSAPLRALLDAGLRDSYRVIAPDDEAAGTFNGFRRSDGAGPKIDYVLVGPHFDVRTASIDRHVYDGHRASDHDAVVAEVALRAERDPAGEAPARPRQGDR